MKALNTRPVKCYIRGKVDDGFTPGDSKCPWNSSKRKTEAKDMPKMSGPLLGLRSLNFFGNGGCQRRICSHLFLNIFARVRRNRPFCGSQFAMVLSFVGLCGILCQTHTVKFWRHVSEAGFHMGIFEIELSQGFAIEFCNPD